MVRKAKVELFEQIRRGYEFGVWTSKGVATKLGGRLGYLAPEEFAAHARQTRSEAPRTPLGQHRKYWPARRPRPQNLTVFCSTRAPDEG